MKNSIFRYEIDSVDGKRLDFADYTGKALLVVNTASKCGFTPQYAGLEALHREFANKGLVVIGFPCDQFGHQEPGTEAEISAFCSVNYGVTFQLTSKVAVNGRKAHPIYEFLKAKAPGKPGARIKWNFTKFLVAPDGTTVKRFGPAAAPESLREEIEKILPS